MAHCPYDLVIYDVYDMDMVVYASVIDEYLLNYQRTRTRRHESSLLPSYTNPINHNKLRFSTLLLRTPNSPSDALTLNA